MVTEIYLVLFIIHTNVFSTPSKDNEKNNSLTAYFIPRIDSYSNENAQCSCNDILRHGIFKTHASVFEILLYNTILGIRDAPVHHVKGRPLYYLVVICTETVC